MQGLRHSLPSSTFNSGACGTNCLSYLSFSNSGISRSEIRFNTHQGHKFSSTGRFSKEQWVEPFIDTSKWEYFDLSCNSRDDTNDKAVQKQIERERRTVLYPSSLLKLNLLLTFYQIFFESFGAFLLTQSSEDKSRIEMNSVLATFSDEWRSCTMLWPRANVWVPSSRTSG